MVTPTTSSIILIPFPFSDLSQSKLRPAFVLANSGKEDWILCQITSKFYADLQAIKLTDNDFANGSLKLVSYARSGKLFTANSSLIVSKIGELKQEKFQKIINAVVNLLINDVKNS
jgi:mRNA interferase MazF